MTTDALIDAMLDDVMLTLDELCRATAAPPHWVRQRVEQGLLATAPSPWHFDAAALRRARVLWRLERDFDAVPELAALVADLEDEIDRLRARLRRAGLE